MKKRVKSGGADNASKPLRITLDRACGKPYVRQLSDAIREAIESGYYKDGDILPSFEELAAAAGVSIIVPREAIARLAESGLVTPRRGVGCVVRSPGTGCRGHVLLITSELVDNRFVASICATVREGLVHAGYRVSQVAVVCGPSGNSDCSQLNILLRSPVSLAVCMTARGGVSRYVAKAGVPVVLMESDRFTGSCNSNVVGRLPWRRFSALPEFVAHCARAGIRHVTEVTTDDLPPVAVEALRSAGVPADEWRCPIVRSAVGENCVEPQVFAAMRKHCRRHRRRHPGELFFAGDDIAARAVLTAFMAEGVRVPEDVFFACWCVRGFEPLSARPLTRLETDAGKIGSAYTRYVLDILEGSRCASCPEDGNRYVIGDTFPV